MKLAEIEKRPPRVPRPPPKSSANVVNNNLSSPPKSSANVVNNNLSPPPRGGPPPPPRPPPPSGSLATGGVGDKVHRTPEVIEFYHWLMKREGKKDIATSVSEARSNVLMEIENRPTVKADVEIQGSCVLEFDPSSKKPETKEDITSLVTSVSISGTNPSEAGGNMIREIENRSTILVPVTEAASDIKADVETQAPEVDKIDTSLVTSGSGIWHDMIEEFENRSMFFAAVKADVETQGDFVQSLATEVRAATFVNIEDLVSFVNWLDEELSFLVDEQEVLKHFDWPEEKADALREADFEYQDLLKLEKQVTSFVDDPNLYYDDILTKMDRLLKEVEQTVFALLSKREMASASRYKEFGIPVDWLQDSGMVEKIKLSSVQLATKYMKRVASELDKKPTREFLALQAVRFALHVHQFAGGFDADSMKAFEELRSRVQTQSVQENKPEA